MQPRTAHDSHLRAFRSLPLALARVDVCEHDISGLRLQDLDPIGVARPGCETAREPLAIDVQHARMCGLLISYRRAQSHAWAQYANTLTRQAARLPPFPNPIAHKIQRGITRAGSCAGSVQYANTYNLATLCIFTRWARAVLCATDSRTHVRKYTVYVHDYVSSLLHFPRSRLTPRPTLLSRFHRSGSLCPLARTEISTSDPLCCPQPAGGREGGSPS